MKVLSNLLGNDTKINANVIAYKDNSNNIMTQEDLNKNITGKKLWTNPNPNSAISQATEITLSSSEYDVLEIFYKNAINSKLVYSTRFLKGHDTRIQILTTDTVLFFRGINYISDTSYRIELPYYTGTVSNANNLCIPLYIVGYKTNLF